MRACAILTHRDDAGGEGRANLDAVLAWLRETHDLDVVVVEQDTHPRLGALPAHPGARVVFAWRAGPFHRAWGLNVGARHASADVLLFGEADVVVPGGLSAAADQVVSGMQVVKPHRQLVDLTHEETRIVRQRGLDALSPTRDEARTEQDAADRHAWLAGGWFGMRRDAFLAVGAFDERFAGRDGGCGAMSLKVERARLSTCELDPGPALRLWHLQPQRSSQTDVGDADAVSPVADYLRCDDAIVARMFEVQRQLHGRRDKYVPDPR